MHVKLELLLWEISLQHSYGTTSFSHHFGVNEVDLPNNPQSKFQVSYWVSVTFQGQTVKLSGGGKQLASTINPSQLQNSPKIPRPECFQDLVGGKKIPWFKNLPFFWGDKIFPRNRRGEKLQDSPASPHQRLDDFHVFASHLPAKKPIQSKRLKDHQIPQQGQRENGYKSSRSFGKVGVKRCVELKMSFF